MSLFVDPQGAFFGMWQPGEHKGAGIVNEPNSLCWNEMVSADVDAAASFYGSVFGWQTAPFGEGQGGEPYTLFMLGENGVGGATTLSAAEVEQPSGSPTFAVADCNSAPRRQSGDR